MIRIFLVAATLLGGLGVILGAFGAHLLEDRLPPERLETWEIAVRYQMYHVFAIALVGFMASSRSSRWFLISGWLFIAGTLIFSGFLYALALTDIKILGAIVPLGGLCQIAGWFTLSVAIWSSFTPARRSDKTTSQNR